MRALELQSNHRDDVLGIVAHELRNPLAPIKAAAELLDRREAGNAEVMRLTKIIRRQLENVERIVEDLVDITRAHSGKLSMEYIAADLRTVIGEAADMVQPAAAAKGSSCLSCCHPHQ